MLSVVEKQDRALLVVAVLAAALIHVSIAVSQSLLGLGVGLMIVFRRRFAFPRIGIPLAVFFALTLLSLLHSVDPWYGRPQIRKFFVFLLMPLMYSVFSVQFDKIRYVIAGWVITATASGICGLVQFFTR